MWLDGRGSLGAQGPGGRRSLAALDHETPSQDHFRTYLAEILTPSGGFGGPRVQVRVEV
jgi:hypothetical protein